MTSKKEEAARQARAKAKVKGILSKPPTASDKPQYANTPYLTNRQDRMLDQQERGDIGIGDIANSQLGSVEQSFSQPYDYSGLPTTPWQQGQDVRALASSYQDQVYNEFARTAEPEFKDQINRFEEEMTTRGIPMGSEIYNREKSRIENAQAGQRQAIRANALQNSESYGNTYNNMATQNYVGANEDMRQRRYDSLRDYGALNAAKSGMGDQNLNYQHQMGLQGAQARAQQKLASMGRGGGGGGQGDFDINKDPTMQRYIAQQEYDKANKPKQPGPWGGFAGNIIGAGLQGWASGGFKT